MCCACITKILALAFVQSKQKKELFLAAGLDTTLIPGWALIGFSMFYSEQLIDRETMFRFEMSCAHIACNDSDTGNLFIWNLYCFIDKKIWSDTYASKFGS